MDDILSLIEASSGIAVFSCFQHCSRGGIDYLEFSIYIVLVLLLLEGTQFKLAAVFLTCYLHVFPGF